MDFQPRGIRIETERLVLRVLGLEDFDDYAAVSADPRPFLGARSDELGRSLDPPCSGTSAIGP